MATAAECRSTKATSSRDKDPAIDEMRTLVEQHYGRRVNGTVLREIADGGGPSSTGRFFGATM